MNTNFSKAYTPRIIFWETTKGCNLRCIHCRATATELSSPLDMKYEKCIGIIDQIASYCSPILVLTGGEPLFRKDIFDLASYASFKKNLRVALATNGTLIDDSIAKRITASGVKRVSISLDGSNAETHDSFRKVEGSFDAAVNGLNIMRQNGMSVQINTTITMHNYKELPDILNLALRLKVDALHFFLLVPVGCGIEIAQEEMVTSEIYENILHWFYDESGKHMIDLKATCAPHYFRVRAQRITQEKKAGLPQQPFIAAGTRYIAEKSGKHDMAAMTKGCLAATGTCFISHKGEIYPCGYLPALAGDLNTSTFEEIWTSSQVFQNLRNPRLLGGKCGICEFNSICEGCRARAYAQTGNYLDEEPFCIYEPSEKINKEG